MKIIHINCVYGEGSTGKIIYDLEQFNNVNNIETIIIYGHGKKLKEKGKHKVLNWISWKINTIYTYISGYMYKGSILGTLKTIKLIKKYNPNIVHLHSINGHMVNIYMLISYLKKNKIPTIITNHAEFFYTGSYTYVPDGSTQYLTGQRERVPNARRLTNSIFLNKTYRAIKKMKKSFAGFETLIVTSVSPWVHKRSKKSYVLKGFHHEVVLNGINTAIFYPRDCSILRKRLNLTNEKIILHVTSGFDNSLKGSGYMLKLAKSLLDKNIKIIFIGIKNNVILPINCINIGVVKNQEQLAEFYSLADVTVLTSKRETFSMIVAESLSCGTPVVGFKAGGPETITIKKFSDFVNFGDIKGLEKKILEKMHYKSPEISSVAHSKYDKSIMANNYLNIYKLLLRRKKENNDD